MGNKPFTLVAAVIFTLMALVHIYRLFTHFQVTVGSHPINQTISIVVIIVAAVLAWGLYRESKR